MLSACLSFCVVATACKRSSEQQDRSSTSVSASASKSPQRASPPVIHCRFGREKASLGDASAKDAGIEDPPFATELGSAVAVGGGFAVTALETKNSITQAFLMQAFRERSGPERVELGPVHGDVQPPALAAAKDSLILAVSDNNAGGSTLRLLRRDARGIKWGPSLNTGQDASLAFGVAASGDRAIVVWDDYLKSEARGIVRAVVFKIDGFAGAENVLDLTASAVDAQNPKILRRDDGYWLGYVVYGAPQQRDQKPAPETEDAGRFELLDAVPSWIQVVPLDRQGVPSAEPISVGEKHLKVLGFELLQTSSGELVVVWRQERATPGSDLAAEAQPGGLNLVRILPDGSMKDERLQLEDPGGGLPSLYKVAGSNGVWLSYVAAKARVGLSRIGFNGLPQPSVDTSNLQAGTALVSYDGRRFLAAQSRGRGVELTTVSCFQSPVKNHRPQKAAPDKTKRD